MHSILPRDDLVVPGTTSKTTSATTTHRQASSITRATSRSNTASRAGTAVNPSASNTKSSSSTIRSSATTTLARPYTALTTMIPISTHSGVTAARLGTHSTLQPGVGQTEKTKPHLHPSKPAIAGAVCGGFAVIVLLVLVIFFAWRRRRVMAKMVGRMKEGIVVEPYIVDHSQQVSSRKNPRPLPSRPASASQIEPVNIGPATALSPDIPRSPPPDYLFHTMDTQQRAPSTYPPSTPESSQFGDEPIGYPDPQPTLEASNVPILGGKSPIDRYERHGRIERYRW